MSRFCLTMGWEDVPHLSDDQKKSMLDALPPHQRDARSKGVPQLGAGAIYPVTETDIVIPEMEIPVHWPKVYSMDIGWNRTAVVWGAWDRENDIVYLYGEHYRGQAEPSIHAQAVKARGTWIPGVIDPASRGRAQHDGNQILETYKNLGLDIETADNSREAGIYAVWERLSSGRLKVFQSLNSWRTEFRLYRRDENGKVVKENDHLMDCLAPETMVITDKGPTRLIDLVGTIGKVLTFDGRFVDYVECGKTRLNTKIVELIFSDNSTVSCTPDHLIMTDSGWVPAVEMVGRRAYKVVQKEVVWQSKLTPKHAKNIKVKNITCAVNTFKETGYDCIEKSGRIILELFQKAATFITSIIINPIIKYQILGSSMEPIIQATTKRDMLGRQPRKQWTPQLNGMQVKVAMNGTSNTIRKCLANFTNIRISSVYNAIRFLTPRSPGITNFAQDIVRRGIDSIPASITRQKNASNVEQNSDSISTSTNNVVREYVECVSLQEKEPSDTYCLRVPETEAFAVGSGIIVHNCTRYLIMSGLDRAKTKPVEKNNVIQFVSSGHGSGWMG